MGILAKFLGKYTKPSKVDKSTVDTNIVKRKAEALLMNVSN